MIKQPWTQEHVDKLNEGQKSGKFHPYTCDRRSDKCEVRHNKSAAYDGKLIATKDGWVCPCGEYKQNWSY